MSMTVATMENHHVFCAKLVFEMTVKKLCSKDGHYRWFTKSLFLKGTIKSKHLFCVHCEVTVDEDKSKSHTCQARRDELEGR